MTAYSATKHLTILSSSGLTLQLSYLEIGEGYPRLLVLSGIHGDERSGQLVIERLLESVPSFRGSLTVLPVANPLAFAMDSRTEPISGLDINRSFTGKVDGRPAFRLATTLLNFVLQHDIIIDLHSFSTAGLIQAAAPPGPDGAVLLARFDPEVVRVEEVSMERRLSGTLASRMAQEHKPYLLVELPHHDRITPTQLDRVADGLAAVVASRPIEARGAAGHLASTQFVRIRLIKAERSGIFHRSAALRVGTAVATGTDLGYIADLPGRERHTITGLYHGIICEANPEDVRVVAAGETICAVGVPIELHERAERLEGLSAIQP